MGRLGLDRLTMLRGLIRNGRMRRGMIRGDIRGLVILGGKGCKYGGLNIIHSYDKQVSWGTFNGVAGIYTRLL